MHSGNSVDILWRGTWFVHELCRNSIRGSSAVRETVNRSIWRNQITYENLVKKCVYYLRSRNLTLTRFVYIETGGKRHV